ncbi:MAG: SufE family protein [Pseudomonadota bacterium]
MDLDELRETFAFFDDWEDKYRFVIDLGKDLPALPEAMRSEENLVRGCQSQVWLYHALDEHGRLQLSMDSDAHIVRGLISIVLLAYQDRTPQETLAFDIDELFGELDLLSHLSPTRGNGLTAMIGKIRASAGSYLAADT